MGLVYLRNSCTIHFSRPHWFRFVFAGKQTVPTGEEEPHVFIWQERLRYACEKEGRGKKTHSKILTRYKYVQKHMITFFITSLRERCHHQHQHAGFVRACGCKKWSKKFDYVEQPFRSSSRKKHKKRGGSLTGANGSLCANEGSGTNIFNHSAAASSFYAEQDDDEKYGELTNKVTRGKGTPLRAIVFAETEKF